MSERSPEPDPTPATADLDAEEYGGLTVEDEGAQTVDPADVAGTADETDEDIGYSPDHTAADQDGPAGS